MDDIARKIFGIQKSLDAMKMEAERLESEKSELMLLFISEMNYTVKKFDVEFDEEGLKLELRRRDYKEFDPMIQFEINKLKKEYDDSIATFKERFETRKKLTEIKAEKEGKVKINPKWYAYVKPLKGEEIKNADD